MAGRSAKSACNCVRFSPTLLCMTTQKPVVLFSYAPLEESAAVATEPPAQAAHPAITTSATPLLTTNRLSSTTDLSCRII